MPSKEEYKSVSTLLLGAVSASLVLFPSILSVVAKPLTAIPLMWIYLGFGLSAFIFLTYTYYRASFTNGDPVRASGLGTISACLSILFFGAFLSFNLLDDQLAPPTITSIGSSGYNALPGDVLTFSAHGDDQNGDRLSWKWEVGFAGRTDKSAAAILPSRLESAIWRIPDASMPGFYNVTATASDGSRSSARETFQVEVRKKQ